MNPTQADEAKALRCAHKNREMGWDFGKCKDCGWVHPDTKHLRSVEMTNVSYAEQWFPSEEAFYMFKTTGVKHWEVENINNLRTQLVSAYAAHKEGRQMSGKAPQGVTFTFRPEIIKLGDCGYGTPRIVERAAIVVSEHYDSAANDDIDVIEFRSEDVARYVFESVTELRTQLAEAQAEIAKLRKE
jgi:hypothetical protein